MSEVLHIGLGTAYLRYLETETAKLPPEFDVHPPEGKEETYARLHVASAFDLRDLFGRLRESGRTDYGQKYGVFFRSQLDPQTPPGFLEAYDAPAHMEARLARDYIFYGKGPLTSDGRCLSFCFWESREAAR